MRRDEIRALVERAGDATFAVDGQGHIIAWNAPCEELFGIPAARALGRACGELVRGTDECGSVCRKECSVLDAVRRRSPVGNLDLRVSGRSGPRWCNVSVLQIEVAGSRSPASVHVVRNIDIRKRLELLIRDFTVLATSLPAGEVTRLLASTRTASRTVALTRQETEVLRLLAQGESTKAVARQLHICGTTVSNHVQRAMRKLGAHTRLEAIRRAERAGLL